MKLSLITILTVCGTALSAFSAEKYVCVSYNRANDRLSQETIVLTPKLSGEVVEGVPAPYSLELFKGAKVSSLLEVDGVVNTEDVSFDFISNDKKVSFDIFLDEMNESSLTIDGKDHGSFICR